MNNASGWSRPLPGFTDHGLGWWTWLQVTVVFKHNRINRTTWSPDRLSEAGFKWVKSVLNAQVSSPDTIDFPGSKSFMFPQSIIYCGSKQKKNIRLSSPSDQWEAFRGCKCHVWGLHPARINQRRSSSSCGGGTVGTLIRNSSDGRVQK